MGDREVHAAGGQVLEGRREGEAEGGPQGEGGREGRRRGHRVTTVEGPTAVAGRMGILTILPTGLPVAARVGDVADP
ncbi:hypothetical protein AFL01nite_24250 [Aeromicrobium flavum]|uniref:Uncharacterized protein n=1 Tax=Aeromicrobium flavum TaxID=416568 RepID=A0A512HXC1_9ACTN|nr:hypothetical protein AFL01nite_24250 [Aeromicrobium flavum]